MRGEALLRQGPRVTVGHLLLHRQPRAGDQHDLLAVKDVAALPVYMSSQWHITVVEHVGGHCHGLMLA
jgi:hypothetical protein